MNCALQGHHLKYPHYAGKRALAVHSSASPLGTRSHFSVPLSIQLHRRPECTNVRLSFLRADSARPWEATAQRHHTFLLRALSKKVIQ